MIAICSLAVRKVAGLVLDGRLLLRLSAAEQPEKWFFFVPGPGHPQLPGSKSITLTHPARPMEQSKEEAAKRRPGPGRGQARGTVVYPSRRSGYPPPRGHPGADAVAAKEREERAREIDIRESTPKAAEKRIDSRVEEFEGG